MNDRPVQTRMCICTGYVSILLFGIPFFWFHFVYPRIWHDELSDRRIRNIVDGAASWPDPAILVFVMTEVFPLGRECPIFSFDQKDTFIPASTGPTRDRIFPVDKHRPSIRPLTRPVRGHFLSEWPDYCFLPNYANLWNLGAINFDPFYLLVKINYLQEQHHPKFKAFFWLEMR